MMQKKKNLLASSDKLWAVDFTVDETPNEDYERLWILAGDLKAAAKKALAYLRPLKAGVVKITKVESEGEIDVF